MSSFSRASLSDIWSVSRPSVSEISERRRVSTSLTSRLSSATSVFVATLSVKANSRASAEALACSGVNSAARQAVDIGQGIEKNLARHASILSQCEGDGEGRHSDCVLIRKECQKQSCKPLGPHPPVQLAG